LKRFHLKIFFRVQFWLLLLLLLLWTRFGVVVCFDKPGGVGGELCVCFFFAQLEQQQEEASSQLA
jgi:hypothetical protein